MLARRGGTQVAEELGMKVGTVYVNASRVLARVRRQCVEYMEDFEDEAIPERPESV